MSDMREYKNYIKEHIKRVREYVAYLAANSEHSNEFYIAAVLGELDVIEQLIDHC